MPSSPNTMVLQYFGEDNTQTQNSEPYIIVVV